MKPICTLIVFFLFSLHSFAQDSTKKLTNLPAYYLTVRKGKLVEYNGDRHRTITKDITLTDASTIHPNGAIDLGSGQSRQLKHGEYLTMDGQIHDIKDLGKQRGSKWKPNKS